MKYRGRLSTPEQFGNIVIRSLADGQVLRLRDVASVELGSDAYNYHTGMALLTSTIVFMAVFIPVSMIGGTSGAFYRQFGLIMAVVR